MKEKEVPAVKNFMRESFSQLGAALLDFVRLDVATAAASTDAVLFIYVNSVKGRIQVVVASVGPALVKELVQEWKDHNHQLEAVELFAPECIQKQEKALVLVADAAAGVSAAPPPLGAAEQAPAAHRLEEVGKRVADAGATTSSADGDGPEKKKR